MGLNREKEAVWIDDGVWDMNGVLVGWVDATNEVPHDKNFEAKYLVYKQPSDSNKSLIYKLIGAARKALFKVSQTKENAVRHNFQVSPEPIPKPAIDGFPDGKTVDGIQKTGSSPEKRVIIREDMYGNSPYAESVWGMSSEGKSVAQYKNRIEELEQRLKAEEGRSSELEQEIDRDEKDKRGGNHHSDLFPEDFEEESYK